MIAKRYVWLLVSPCLFALGAACSSSSGTDERQGSGGTAASTGGASTAGTTTTIGGVGGDVGTMVTGGAPAGGEPATSGGSGGTGGSATAGTGGTGGVYVGLTCPMTVTPAAPMIDSVEGAEAHADTDNGIPGHWWVFGDNTEGSSSDSPWKGNGTTAGYYPATLDPPRGDSQRAIWFEENGFTTWGVAFGISVASCVDASAYTGVTFWTLSKSAIPIEFDIGTYDTVPDNGCTGTCDGKYKTTLNLPAEWKEWTIPFDSLMATGAATQIPFEKNKITAINFVVGPMDTFDIYVDDVAFY